MTDLLLEFKKAIGAEGNDNLDNQLTFFLNEAKGYLLQAGVSEAVLNSDKSVGVIVKGAFDLWNDGMLSSYFLERADYLRRLKE